MVGGQKNLRVVAFEVTRRCRYACRHCRAEAGVQAGNDALDTAKCKRILEAVADYCRPMVIITGGEPLERQDIFELIGFGSGLGLKMAMATCGYRINEESARQLKQAGLGALSISIDGATAESNDRFRGTEGAFAAAVGAARAAKEAGLRFQINTTISRINAYEIEKIAESARGLGASCFNAFILVPTGRGRDISDAILTGDEYGQVLERLASLKLSSDIEIRVTCGPQFARVWREKGLEEGVKGCLGGREFGFISSRGDVQICGFLGISGGNLVKNGYDFGKIWENSGLFSSVRDTNRYKGRCGDCEHRLVCGGCRARAHSMRGDYLGEDPICKFGGRHKERDELTGFQKRLCNLLQEGLAICERPFAQVAAELRCSEEEVLEGVRALKKQGVIRRIGAVINYRAIGMAGTLVAAHVPEGKLTAVTEAVNSLRGVSHNYLREHFYNLWFTLRARSREQIDETLKQLNGDFGVEFHSVPARRVFKLKVKFDVEGREQAEPCEVPVDRAIVLEEREKEILGLLGEDLEIVERPFEKLCGGEEKNGELLGIIAGLKSKGVIRRVGAVVDHRKLGFLANALFVCEVAEERVEAAGRKLAGLKMVSHCYERQRFEGWPYNIYAMMHARVMDEIQQAVKRFAEEEQTASFELLPTVAEGIDCALNGMCSFVEGCIPGDALQEVQEDVIDTGADPGNLCHFEL